MTNTTQAASNIRELPYKNKGNLIDGPVGGHLIRLTVPMIWGILAMISFQLVDTFYVSLLGTEKLAAISFTFPLTYMIFSFIMGFGIAMSSVLSRLIGAGEEGIVRRVASHGLILVFIIGLIIALLGRGFHDSLFRLMGAEEGMIPLIRDYMMVWFTGAIFMATPIVGNSAIRATGNSMVPAMIMLSMAVVNVVLDPILIFGLLGFPRLELYGAALATVFANGCAMVAGLVVIYRKGLLPGVRHLQPDLFGDSVKRLIHIALPAGLTNAIQPLVNAVIISILATYGTETVAAYGVVSRLEAFAFVILMALSVGLAPVVGQNWGAQRFERVHEVLRLAIRFSVLWSIFIAAGFWFFGEALARLFSDDPNVIRYVVLFFTVVPITYAFGNLVMGWASAFNAMGRPQHSFLMIVVKMIVLSVPAVYIGHHLGGVLGIFFGIGAANVISGLFFHILNWRLCKKFEMKAG